MHSIWAVVSRGKPDSSCLQVVLWGLGRVFSLAVPLDTSTSFVTNQLAAVTRVLLRQSGPRLSCRKYSSLTIDDRFYGQISQEQKTWVLKGVGRSGKRTLLPKDILPAPPPAPSSSPLGILPRRFLAMFLTAFAKYLES